MRPKALAMTSLAIAVLLSSVFSMLFASPAIAQASRQPISEHSDYKVCAPIDMVKLRKPYIYKFGLPSDELQNDFFDQSNPNSYNNQGFRPARLTGYQAGSEIRFSTKWLQIGGGHWYSRFGITDDVFHQEYLDHKDTHRPIDVSGYNTPHGVRYNVIYQENLEGVAWKIHRDVSRPGMEDLVDKYKHEGYVPVRVEGYIRDGQLTFISIWEKSDCRWQMHNQMTREQYQDRFDEYKHDLRLVHLDAYNVDGEVFYAGIWWVQDGPVQMVHSNRDWYLHQRDFNNRSAEGYVIDNFLAVDDPNNLVRYGGIWTFFQEPNIGPEHLMAQRMRKHIDSAPARGGVAMINLTTGEEIMIHADQRFGTASTIKSAILYTLLRKVDAEGLDLDTTMLNVEGQYGSNGGGLLTPNQLYSLSYLAQIMIDSSHNWATNRLIDYVSMDVINQTLEDLGFEKIKLDRYMMGTGAPSAHGNADPADDYRDGHDNLASPREYATFLRLVYENQDDLLSQDSHDRFFAILSNVQNKGFAPGFFGQAVAPNWGDLLTLYNKAGSNLWTGAPGDFTHKPQLGDHSQGSDAGVIEFTSGDVVVFAMFLDERDGGSSGDPLLCIGMEIAIEFSSVSTGVIPASCQ